MNLTTSVLYCKAGSGTGVLNLRVLILQCYSLFRHLPSTKKMNHRLQERFNDF